MPTATYEADFSQFTSAVRGAETQLRSLEAGAHKVSSSIDNVGGILRGLAGAFGIAFSAASVINFGREVLRTADELMKLSDRTGLSVQALQQFQIAGGDAGNTIGELSAAVVQLEDRVAGGDKSALRAFEKLGINIDAFKQLSPEQKVIAWSDALREAGASVNAINVAMDSGGRAMVAILPTMKRGFDDVRDGAVGMSVASVKALDDLGDAIQRTYRWMGALAGEHLGRSIEGWQILGGLFDSTATTMDVAGPAAQRLAESMKNVAPPGLPDNLKQIERGLTDDAEAAIKLNKAADDAREALERLQTIQQEHIQSIAGKLFGADDIKRATDYAEAIGAVENVSNLSMEAQEELTEVMKKGVEAMIAAGLGTDELTSRFEAMRIQAGKTGRDAAEAMKRIEESLDGVIAKALAAQAAMSIPGLSITGGASPLNATGTVTFGMNGEMITGGGSQFVPGSGVTVFGGGGSVATAPGVMVHPSISGGGIHSGGVTVNANINVVDTQANLAREISRELTRSVMQRTHPRQGAHRPRG